MTDPATIHVDGGARGNPGPAAYAVVISRPGLPPVEEAAPIGTATNNVAEYTALIRALEIAADLGLRRLSVFSDSELMVKQMQGEYRVKHPDLQELYAEAVALRKRFDGVTLAHVRREQNKRADFLCNEALDGRPRKAGEAPPPEPERRPKPAKAAKPAAVVTDERVRGDCLTCLGAAAKAWAANGGTSPPAAAVWEQLWSILEEGGVLRKRK